LSFLVFSRIFASFFFFWFETLNIAAPARLLASSGLTSLLKYFIYPNEEMAQHRSPRKSLQLNRANTPITVDGPMQDVNVSLSFLLLFMPTLRARAHWSRLSLSLSFSLLIE
tara:strand:+ start:210 stop:545 length:336 start_codon:yes stop_codon:yes gene_type:complete